MKEQERKILKTVFIAVMILAVGLSAMVSGFFVKGKLKERKVEALCHEERLKDSYRFTNMETLEFLTVSDIEEYRKAFENSLELEKVGTLSKVTILDSVAKSSDGASYEWLTACDDKNATLLVNRFDKTNRFFSVLPYDHETGGGVQLSEEEKERIKQEATRVDDHYVIGTLDDMSEIAPTIKGMEALAQTMGAEPANDAVEKLRVFLVETSNSRRAFLLDQIKDGTGNAVVLLKAATVLGKDDEIRGSYDKVEKRWEFTYVD